MTRKCSLYVDTFDRFDQEFFHLLCRIYFHDAYIHVYFLSVNIMQIVFLERLKISNVCSDSVHACETLWSDSNRADRKDFTKINGAAPADPLSTLGFQIKQFAL